MFHPLGIQSYRKGYQNGDDTFYNSFHRGADMIISPNHKVYSMNSGVVDRVYHGQGGLTICIKNEQHYIRYMHMNEAHVEEGQEVKGQEVIGLSGGHPDHPNAGLSTAPHLHVDISANPFDLYDTSNFVDPYFLMEDPVVEYRTLEEVQQDLHYSFVSLVGTALNSRYAKFEAKKIYNKDITLDQVHKLHKESLKDYIKHVFSPHNYMMNHNGLKAKYGIQKRGKKLDEVVENNFNDILSHYIAYGVAEGIGDGS